MIDGPELGHTFRITVSSRTSYRVVGQPGHHDAEDFFDPSAPVDVRAWDLRTALHMAAELPLDTWFPDRDLCEPHITQDGYDSGQLFVCAQHNVSEPVLGADGRQTYEVTLPMFQRLVAEHHRKVAES